MKVGLTALTMAEYFPDVNEQDDFKIEEKKAYWLFATIGLVLENIFL